MSVWQGALKPHERHNYDFFCFFTVCGYYPEENVKETIFVGV
jgi:hypothetical protein